MHCNFLKIKINSRLVKYTDIKCQKKLSWMRLKSNLIRNFEKTFHFTMNQYNFKILWFQNYYKHILMSYSKSKCYSNFFILQLKFTFSLVDFDSHSHYPSPPIVVHFQPPSIDSSSMLWFVISLFITLYCVMVSHILFVNILKYGIIRKFI